MKLEIIISKLNILLLYIIDKINSKIQLNDINENSPHIAVIPFRIFYPPKIYNYSFSCRDYFETIHSSLPYLEIEIGDNIKVKNLTKEEQLKLKDKKQILSLFIVIDDYSFYIDDNYFYSEEKKKLCRYSTSLSTTYEIDPAKNIIQKNKYSVIANDYLKIFSDISLNNYEKIKIEFKHNYDKNKNILFACGKVGLLTSSNKLKTEVNFINQIHSNLENIDYSFSFQFQNDNIEKNDNGLFIIGLESYEKYKKEELISIYSKQKSTGAKYEWRFKFDQITINNQLYDFNDEEFVFKPEVEGIEIPYSFYEKLNYLFFRSFFTSKICQTEIVNNFYIMISCSAENFTIKDIKKFPQINFLRYQIGYNFTFFGEELFYQKDNIYYFKIISYLEKFKTDFKLGKIFLRKYPVIFNPESKSIFFYKNNYNNINKNHNDNEKKKKNIALLTFSYIFISTVFLLVGIYFGRKFCNMRRKIYANELEDDNYVYISKKEDLKKDRNLIEL